jgi:methylated-DNA-[protein]-cysteine S-methyltransferase
MSFYYKTIDSPVGKLKLIASDQGLVAILWGKDKPNRVKLDTTVESKNHPILLEGNKQLHEYFAQKRKTFSINLDIQGTSFQQRVWKALLTIPYGKTRSYGELAKQIQHPKASRAVGAANGKNPLPIIIPCHRVIGANGKLVGFTGGLHIKEKLLSIEKVLY